MILKMSNLAIWLFFSFCFVPAIWPQCPKISIIHPHPPTRPRLHSCLSESHNEAVMCCGYSEEFRQVVSCSDGSVSKMRALQRVDQLCTGNKWMVCFGEETWVQAVTGFRWWKSGTLTLGIRFWSLVARRIWLASHAWHLTPVGGGMIYEEVPLFLKYSATSSWRVFVF